MSKLLLAFSVAALLYGDCAFGMDNKDELYENPWEDVPSESQNEKKPNYQSKDELLKLQREKIAKYESTLQKLTQELKEEREKNRLTEEKIEKLMKILENNDALKKELYALEAPAKDAIISNPDQSLFNAVASGNLSDVKKLINKRTDINAKNPEGATPLYIAARNGYENIVKYLVEHNAKIDEGLNDKTTPLYIATRNGYENIVKYLVEHNANINKESNMGITPLAIAAYKKHETLVKHLIEHKAEINKGVKSPLHIASQNGDKKMVQYLLEHGANIEKENEEGATPLWIAAQKGHLNIVKYLANQGADINKENKHGIDPLSIAKSELQQSHDSKQYQKIISYLESKKNTNSTTLDSQNIEEKLITAIIPISKYEYIKI